MVEFTCSNAARFSLCMLLCLASFSCSGDSSSVSSTESEMGDLSAGSAEGAQAGAQAGAMAETPPFTFTVDTYNTGLAYGYVEYTMERLPHLIEVLSAYESDLICLQEVWRSDDREAIVASAQARFPHASWEVTERTEVNPGCSAEEVEPLRTCIETRCPDISPGELASCGLDQCGMEFEAASSQCQTCIATHLGQSLEEIIMSCEGGGPSFFYGGHNGLLILSKYPLTQPQHLELTSTLVQRAVLSVQVDLPIDRSIAVHCTHLASDLSGSIQYHGDLFESFAEEQNAQINELLSWSQTPDLSQPHLILGDLNTGPETQESEAELAENFELFMSAGYTSPYATPESQCTYCRQNTIIGNEGPGGYIIDHILMRGFSEVGVDHRRTFDQTSPISIDNAAPRDLHLSDHYGVQVTLSMEVE
jgi:endonuclease/exonuclease/phosphatase family metal-dependent hydrolase